MHSGCLRHTDLPGTSPLFADFLYHRDRTAPFYELPFQDPASYAAAARSVDFPAARRAALVEALREQNGPSAELEMLARPDTVAVVTGQQVGLFSGPCYTVYKALTAARLTADLRSRGIPAVAIFWLATEDHDFAEINHCWSFNAALEPVALSVSAAADHTPAGEVRIARYPVDALRSSLEGFPFGDSISALAASAYEDGESMGAACANLLRRILPDLGLLYLDPMRPAIRAIAAPLLRDAVALAPRLAELILERNRELEAAGYHAQVHFEDKTSFFFLLDQGRRLTLKRSGDSYFADSGRAFPAAELASRALHISPNALLRPVVQDYLLPTVAQIGGPAEVAYLAQSQVLYRALGRPAPVVVPRTGFTLLDSRGTKLMDRYSLAMSDFFEGPDAVRARISSTLVPAALRQTLEATRANAASALDRLHAELSGFDPTLAASLAKSRAKIQHHFSKIEAKTARESLRRDARAQDEADYLCNLIYPNKHLQERVFTFLPFAARHGLDLVSTLRDAVRLDCHDHHVLPLA